MTRSGRGGKPGGGPRTGDAAGDDGVAARGTGKRSVCAARGAGDDDVGAARGAGEGEVGAARGAEDGAGVPRERRPGET